MTNSETRGSHERANWPQPPPPPVL